MRPDDVFPILLYQVIHREQQAAWARQACVSFRQLHYGKLVEHWTLLLHTVRVQRSLRSASSFQSTVFPQSVVQAVLIVPPQETRWQDSRGGDPGCDNVLGGIGLDKRVRSSTASNYVLMESPPKASFLRSEDPQMAIEFTQRLATEYTRKERFAALHATPLTKSKSVFLAMVQEDWRIQRMDFETCKRNESDWTREKRRSR